MKPSSLTFKTILIAIFFLGVALRADEKKAVAKKPVQAGFAPMVNLTPKEEIVKFVPCENDNDCYRALQESDVELGQGEKSEDGVALVAEFVEGPQKGIRVVRKKN